MQIVHRAAMAAMLAAAMLSSCSEPGDPARAPAASPAPGAEDADAASFLANAGFEEGEPGAPPPGWTIRSPNHEGAQSAEAALSGASGLVMRWTGEGRSSPNAPGVLTQIVDAAPFRGQRVRFSVSGRFPDGAGELGQMWLRVDGPGSVISISNSDPEGAITGGEWAGGGIVVTVPEAAESLALGVALYGAGPLHLDDFRLAPLGAVSPDELAPPAPVSEQGLDNLAAFARLYGYVRYFHPSDEAASADWDEIALAGVERVEGASGPDVLRSALEELFTPVAPTLHIVEDGAPPDGFVFRPGADLIAWRRAGLGASGQPGVYAGERVPAPADLPDVARLPLGGGLIAHVPLKAARGPDGATMPAATAAAVRSSKPEGFTATGDDRVSRLATVVIAWNVLQHFYPYWDTVETDWQGQLRDSLARAAEDPDAEAFDETVWRLSAASRDGHGNAYRAPGPGAPPLQWRWIEDSLVITAADPASGLMPGDVVAAVGGRSTDEVMADWMARAPASTPGWRRVKALQLIAMGDLGDTLALTLERASGETETLEVGYGAPEDQPQEPRPEPLAELEPGLVYADLTRLTVEMLQQNMDLLAGAEGLVFDLRGYPEGQAAVMVLPHLSDAPIVSAQFNLPTYFQPDQQSVTFRNGAWNIPPQAPRFAARRVVFLTDERAISYAESVMGVVEGLGLGEIVGAPTAGTNGNIDRVALPTGHQLIWTGMQVLKHDGSPHHGVGILPTIPAAPTVEGVRAGRDEVLEDGLAAARG